MAAKGAQARIAVAENGGRIRPQVSVVKAFASALWIANDGSVAGVCPIAQIAGGLVEAPARPATTSSAPPQLPAPVLASALSGSAQTVLDPIEDACYS